MDYLKLFQTHQEYEEFVSGGTMVRPNVSHCVADNEVHYNAKPCTLTPKQLVEHVHSFMVSKDEKFLQYRQEHMEEEYYENICEQKMSREFQKLAYYKEVRYRIFQFWMSTGDITYAPNNSEIFDLDIRNDIGGPRIRFDDGTDYIEYYTWLYKANETFNGNDVFYIASTDAYGSSIEVYEYQEDGEDICYGCEEYAEFDDAAKKVALYGDNMVLLCPHNTYANFTIAYPDGNGGYTATKPSSITLTPTITNNSFNVNPEWISITLFQYQDQEINTRVNNALAILRSNINNWFNGDFSVLSVLDDIKIEVPRDVYEIIKNPWTYLDEEYIFNGQEPSNP